MKIGIITDIHSNTNTVHPTFFQQKSAFPGGSGDLTIPGVHMRKYFDRWVIYDGRHGIMMGDGERTLLDEWTMENGQWKMQDEILRISLN